MRSAGSVLMLGVKPCPRATPLGQGVHLASQHLTSFAPHPLHKPANGGRCPWSQQFDHIFRNEGSRVQIQSAPPKPLVRAISCVH